MTQETSGLVRGRSFLSAFLVIYGLGVSLCFPYYNWQYAKTHGFTRWLWFGEVVATGKSIFWPYFLLPSSQTQRHEDPSDLHYTQSHKASQEAVKILIETGGGPLDLTPTEKQEVLQLLQLALSEAGKVDKSYLQKVHPDLEEKYQDGYREALLVLYQGLQSDNKALVLGGTYGYNEFATWMSSKRGELRFP